MKTLIINGSPRDKGDTSSLVKIVTDNLIGEHRVLNSYRCNVSACLDCRFCWDNAGCTINDEMQEIYDYIQVCDNILIASPIYFSELTGKLLDVGSRLQTYFCARFFRKENPIMKPKKGAVILVGGGDGHMDKPYTTACTLLHHMNCYDIHEAVCCHNTNIRPAIKEDKVLDGCNSIANFFNAVNR
ncbi:MAG: flavodoxin family protein [Phocaeicola sp.]